MKTEVIALILSIASFVGVIAGPIITNVISARQATVERREAMGESRRTERLDYLNGNMQTLIRLRSKLQGSRKETMRTTFNEYYAESFSIMLSIADRDIRNCALEAMRLQHGLGRGERMVDAMMVPISDSIRYLGDMVAEVIREG